MKMRRPFFQERPLERLSKAERRNQIWSKRVTRRQRIGFYLAAISLHVAQSLRAAGAEEDCTPVITYQDKRLKCQVCFLFPPAAFDV